MDKWTKIRRDVFVGGMSRRQAAEKYNLNFRTIQKVLEREEPPSHRKKADAISRLPGLGVILREIFPFQGTGRVFFSLRVMTPGNGPVSSRFWMAFNNSPRRSPSPIIP